MLSFLGPLLSLVGTFNGYFWTRLVYVGAEFSFFLGGNQDNLSHLTTT